MRKLIMLGAVVLAVLGAVGCDTLNIGSGGPVRGPQVTLGAVPTGLFAGDTGNFTASWTDSTSPYTVSWTFGGGANPNAVGPINAGAGLSDAQSVTFSEGLGGTFTVTVTVTDASGNSGSDDATYTYGPTQNVAPVLTLVSDGAASITVHGVDADGDAITVTATAPAGTTTGGAQIIPAGAGGDVTFDFSADDFFAGASGTATFQGDDLKNTNNLSNELSGSVVIGAISLAADTLYAIPLVSSAAAADAVTIVVASGVPANPFQFMNGCRVTAPTGFAYVSGTFNVGVPGGGAGDVDGFWTGMNPGGGFLLPPDNFIVETDLGGGSIGIDFNVTPIGGSDRTTDEGALFNFGANFGAGNNVLGFQDVSGVSRTYYTDSNAAPDRFWGDITNADPNVPNSVNVS